MKTYQQFIVEAKPPKPDALQTIGDNLRKRTPGMKFIATKDRIGDIRLNSIEVPKDKRGQGIGTRAMKGLTKFADKQGNRITLSQQPDKGKKAKLDKFYRGFNFKPNKGRNKDFRVSDTMIRDPHR